MGLFVKGGVGDCRTIVFVIELMECMGVTGWNGYNNTVFPHKIMNIRCLLVR